MSDEDQKVFMELNKKRTSIQKAMRVAIREMLTDEQLKMLPNKKKGNAVGEMVTVSVKLPNMT